MSSVTEKLKFVETIKFVTRLSEHQQGGSWAATEDGIDPQLALLRSWQSNRLAHTYADFLDHPKYRASCQFFLNDVYASRNFNQRDQDIEYLYAAMSRFLPSFLLGLVRNTIEMNNLTKKLDQDLLNALVGEVGMVDTLTPEMYAQAYRICDNYDERVHQINLIVEVGRQVNLGTSIPLVGTTLRLARQPAYSAGWHELHDFLERGYLAFKKMPSPKKFLSTIQKREMEILDRIYSNAPNPFSIDAG